jgi:cytoskeletal protein CcmA (bactofilin family)
MSMFNKRQNEEPTPPQRPVTPAASPQMDVKDVKKENLPVSSMPFKTPESDVKSGQASIGKAVKINGQIFSKEDLYIDGDVEGTVELHENRLTIGPNGRVQAAVRAREVVVLGAIQGNVEASDRIDIRKEARLVGDIKTARIVIEDGAYFKGSIDIVRPEPQKALGGAAAAAAPAAPKPAVAGAGVGSSPAVPVEVKR